MRVQFAPESVSSLGRNTQAVDSETDFTFSVVLGDVDGDLDLDVDANPQPDPGGLSSTSS